MIEPGKAPKYAHDIKGFIGPCS